MRLTGSNMELILISLSFPTVTLKLAIGKVSEYEYDEEGVIEYHHFQRRVAMGQ